MSFTKLLGCLWLATLFAIPLFSQPKVGSPEAKAKATKSIFDLFHSSEVVKIDLETALTPILEKSLKDQDQPATLTFEDESGTEQKFQGAVNIRGKYRRRICQFPPLKLNLSKAELEARGLKKYDDYKLVTHCLDTDEGQEIILREYLVYKLYELVSDVALRAQLVKIRYIDTESNKKIIRYGIILEDEKELADRIGLKICDECFNVSKEEFDNETANILAMFEYMIGNTDYSIKMLRNLLMLRPEEEGLYQIVPYDFDFSGLVNASYIVPDLNLGLASARDRRFKGLAQTTEELEPTIRHFQSKKEELLDCVKNFKLLFPESREDIRQYLISFFKSLEEGIHFAGEDGKY